MGHVRVHNNSHHIISVKCTSASCGKVHKIHNVQNRNTSYYTYQTTISLNNSISIIIIPRKPDDVMHLQCKPLSCKFTRTISFLNPLKLFCNLICGCSAWILMCAIHWYTRLGFISYFKWCKFCADESNITLRWSIFLLPVCTCQFPIVF